MLAERHAADADPDPVVTAEEWLAAHRVVETAEDLHRGHHRGRPRDRRRRLDRRGDRRRRAS